MCRIFLLLVLKGQLSVVKKNLPIFKELHNRYSFILWVLNILEADNSQDTSEPVVLLKESFYHAFALCGDVVKSSDMLLKKFFVGHVKLHFDRQHFLVKRRIAEALRTWSQSVIRGKMTGLAFGRFQLGSY